MRDILFRGKRVENGDWFEGHLVRFAGMYFIFADDKHECHTVVHSTIGQFTGVLDKNGKKIFEGDIVKCYVDHCVGCYPHTETVIIPVTYASGTFSPLQSCDHRMTQILGNIHDNPDILGAAK